MDAVEAVVVAVKAELASDAAPPLAHDVSS